jgi:hypothetical protein
MSTIYTHGRRPVAYQDPRLAPIVIDTDQLRQAIAEDPFVVTMRRYIEEVEAERKASRVSHPES